MAKPSRDVPIAAHGLPATLRMQDLGHEGLLSALAELHLEYFSEPASVWGHLAQPVQEFLDAHHNDNEALDAYANNFTITAMQLVHRGNWSAALRVWERALEPVFAWERANAATVHKGSLMYYAGGTAVLAGDFDLGFLYLHKAVEEDRRSGAPNPAALPAWKFVALEEGQQTLWQPLIRSVSNYLRDRLADYRQQCGTTLTLEDLRARILRAQNLESVAFYFVRTLFGIHRETSVREEILDPVFAPLQRVRHLAGLYLVTEELLRAKMGQKTMAGLVTDFSVSRLLTLHSADPVQTPKRRLDVVKDDFEANPDGVLVALSDGSYAGTQLSRIEMALGISPPLRNFGAHQIEPRPALVQHFREIVQLALNAVFYVVEAAYP